MTRLAEELKERIRRSGPITFHDFMAAAVEAYYARGPAIGGPGADFSTSVAFPAFRRAVATLARGLPAGWRVVELGAGTGALARDLAATGREVVTVDASPGLRALQAAASGVRAVARCEDLAPGPSLVFGNEVLDALPVSRVVGGPDGALLEVMVDVDAAGRFKERLGPARDPRLAARFARIGVRPQRGQICDVAPALEDLVRSAARLADPGLLVLIDYGDPAAQLYAPTRLNGTLATYKAHGKWLDPFEDVGERDITADVDFTAVGLAARDAGLEPLGLVDQGDFLRALGVDPDDVTARASALGTAFRVFAARRGTDARVPGF